MRNEKEKRFDKVVVAAGVWSNVLAKTIGDNFPLDTERGYHIIFENKNNLLNHPVGWAKTGFYMTPMEDGIRVAGTVEIAGFKKPRKVIFVEELPIKNGEMDRELVKEMYGS